MDTVLRCGITLCDLLCLLRQARAIQLTNLQCFKCLEYMVYGGSETLSRATDIHPTCILGLSYDAQTPLSPLTSPHFAD